MALINKISAVADAVRERSGYTGGMTLEEMATEIKAIPYPVVEEIEITENGTYTPPEGVDGFSSVTVATTGSVEVEPIVLSKTCNYSCAGPMSAVYINLFGNTTSTENVVDSSYMFYKNPLEKIPFDINFDSSTVAAKTYKMFEDSKIKELPKLNNLRVNDSSYMFSGAYYLREIPEDIDATWDWSYADNMTGSYSGGFLYGFFNNSYSLRKFPMHLLNHGNPVANQYNTIYSSTFTRCCALDEIIGLPFPHTATYTSNIFSDAFNGCSRLKELTFAVQEDGSPYVMPWKNQTIDLSKTGYPEYSFYVNNIYTYNSGITRDKEVKDDATYAALKDDPDWFTADVNYSRYNHDSAVNTINSLPDCSATGTNTIKFTGAAGAKTDGGAINTLTEEEIAVAAAKGWTVSLV